MPARYSEYLSGAGVQATILRGDCLGTMRGFEDNSIDSVVTDPPYGFYAPASRKRSWRDAIDVPGSPGGSASTGKVIGLGWDDALPTVDIWREALRVLKPGGHLLAFAGTRTQHRMAVSIEDAGFEIRDMLAWIYGVGFPKASDISKAIDKAAGAERESVRIQKGLDGKVQNYGYPACAQGHDRSQMLYFDVTIPATELAKKWDGWMTTLKPAMEPITMARKPIPGTVFENVLEHGTGALNIGGTLIKGDRPEWEQKAGVEFERDRRRTGSPEDGRWASNVLHDGSEEAFSVFPEASRRFFYSGKASQADRNEGLGGEGQPERNVHPTVKPTDVMRWLIRLVTPPGGVVLDPFMGSGSTGKAAVLEGMNFIGCEMDAKYCEISMARILAAEKGLDEEATA